MKIEKLFFALMCSWAIIACQTAQTPTATVEIPTNTAIPTSTQTSIPPTATTTPSPIPLPKAVPYTRSTSRIGTFPTFINNSTTYLYLNGAYHDFIENTIIGLTSGQSIKLPDMTSGAVSFFRDTNQNIIFVYVTSEEEFQKIEITKDAVALALENPIQSLPYLKSLWSGNAVTVNFINNSSALLKCYWVDFDGNEEYYEIIEPSQTLSVETNFGNAWIIRNSTGNIVFYYYVTGLDQQNVPISEDTISSAIKP